MEVFTILFIGHWVGDFVLQSSNMALKKSHSLKWLSIHIATYTAVFFVFSVVAIGFGLGWKFALVNGIIHFFVDLVTSKVVAKYSDRPRVYYPLIGFDQLLHILSIIWTFEYLNIYT